MSINPNPENLSPAGIALRIDLINAAISLMRGYGFVQTPGQPQPPNTPTITEVTMSVNPYAIPHFIESRLPARGAQSPGSPPPETYHLYARDKRPHGFHPSGISFLGKVSISRDEELDPWTGLTREWTVNYYINSLKRRVLRSVTGAIVEYESGIEITRRRLPNRDVKAAFPEKLAVTEAWQLIRLLRDPRQSSEAIPPGEPMW